MPYFHTQFRVTFIKLNDDPINISNQSYAIDDLISFEVFRRVGGQPVEQTANLRQKMTVTLNAISPTCQLANGHAVLNLRLPTVSPHAFPYIGSTYSGSTRSDIQLRCSDPYVNVFATLSDANDATNRSDILTNTGSAEGVGVQLLSTYPDLGYGGRDHCTPSIPCRFGPDTREKGAQHQFPVHFDANSLVGGTALRARYIRTGRIKPGNVRATATITFSYQ